MRVLCTSVLVLAGCAVVPSGLERVAEGKKQLSDAKVCCTTLADARRMALPSDRSTLTIDNTQQAFDFGAGKAFFVLYELPVFERTYSVSISSMPGGPLTDMALFVPLVALYDASFRRTRFFDEKTLRNRGNTLERTIFINPGDASEKYLVVSGSDLSSSIETSYSTVTYTPVVAGPVVFNIVGGQDGKTHLRTSPTGQLEIEVGGLTQQRTK